MATLVEGREYGLASNVSTSGNKTFIHFKLTDSALRALEEYSKIKNGCSRKPTIQFKDTTGVMCIPAQVSSHDPKAERSFQLSLTKIHGDDNGSFDCVQQSARRPGGGLQYVGSLHHRVVTHANNEVYTDTRKKMAIADSELKKSCAKEIKMSGRFSGKKIKKVIPAGQYKPPPKPLTSSARPMTTTPPPGAQHSSVGASSRLTPPPSSGHSPHRPSTLNLGKSGNKPVSAISSSNGVVKTGPPHNKPSSGIISMPYKDRVIHLLALRPYKKPELLARLMKDGIREKDRNSLGAILKQVAVMNKDNTYLLARHAWTDVRQDWPYYSDTDRTLLKRNQQQMESRTSPSQPISPAASLLESPSQHKRSIEDSIDSVPAKKQRISHHEKHHAPSNGKLSNGLLADLPIGNNNHKQPMSNGNASTPNSTDKNTSPIPESPSSNLENQEKGGDHSDSTVPDYVLQYRSIEDRNQRARYKEDFNHEYEEYRRLHEKVQNVAKRFQYLRERISNTKEGSQDYEELKNKVLAEYQQQKNDPKFREHKRRVDYLHEKLGHIKRLIQDYDRRHELASVS